ncbi:hypothetical protein DWW52_18415 [Odoribacter sp. AF15-53]|nr:hypothetical protein DWW52_18415 [Odoribacter sp. AF15-53]
MLLTQFKLHSRKIYSSCKSVAGARLKLTLWYNQVNEASFHSFNSVAASVFAHSNSILNFFNNRSTNASTESFYAKLKAFKALFRGVLDIKFFFSLESLKFSHEKDRGKTTKNKRSTQFFT